MARRTALFLSPHLDDVAFSCGGLAAILADAGWHTVLATLFTRSILSPKGFALACQLDKALDPDIDYMALRRGEDTLAAGILDVGIVRWMGLPEAPHRGYGSPAELFGGIRNDDSAAAEITTAMRSLDTAHRPHLVLAPQGIGNHVDHRLVTSCALAAFGALRLAYYRDAPYVIRHPEARPSLGTDGGTHTAIDISRALERKISASAAYTTQVGFQFGGLDHLAVALRHFAMQEGQGAIAAETFLGCPISI